MKTVAPHAVARLRAMSADPVYVVKREGMRVQLLRMHAGIADRGTAIMGSTATAKMVIELFHKLNVGDTPEDKFRTAVIMADASKHAAQRRASGRPVGRLR